MFFSDNTLESSNSVGHRTSDEQRSFRVSLNEDQKQYIRELCSSRDRYKILMRPCMNNIRVRRIFRKIDAIIEEVTERFYADAARAQNEHSGA